MKNASSRFLLARSGVDVNFPQHLGVAFQLVDDLLATGGTMEACCRLLERCDAEIVGCSFLIHLVQLGGEERLSPYRIHSVLRYDQDDHEQELSL